jgi:hypothetical protein
LVHRPCVPLVARDVAPFFGLGLVALGLSGSQPDTEARRGVPANPPAGRYPGFQARQWPFGHPARLDWAFVAAALPEPSAGPTAFAASFSRTRTWCYPEVRARHLQARPPIPAASPQVRPPVGPFGTSRIDLRRGQPVVCRTLARRCRRLRCPGGFLQGVAHRPAFTPDGGTPKAHRRLAFAPDGHTGLRPTCITGPPAVRRRVSRRFSWC